MVPQESQDREEIPGGPNWRSQIRFVAPVGAVQCLCGRGFSLRIETLVSETFGHLHNFAMVDNLSQLLFLCVADGRCYEVTSPPEYATAISGAAEAQKDGG